jgi:Fic family protein
LAAALNGQDFKDGFPGRLVPAVHNSLAFVPAPLPPELNLGRTTILLLTEASALVGQLHSAGKDLPNPHLLIQPLVRREAIYSSRIEGTVATAQELLLFDLAPRTPPARSDVQEVANYVGALKLGMRRRARLPVSLRLIRDLHAELMRGVRGEEKRPGEFRTIQNYIAQPGQPIEAARFVPPPPEQLMACLDEFENYLHRQHEWPFLIELPLIHYQFEAIHPFLDGNGRVGRLLITLLLLEKNLLVQPLLYLSAYLERNRKDYYDHLLAVSQQGRWTEWIEFFLRGVVEQARDAALRCRRLFELRKKYHQAVQQARVSALTLRLVDELFAFPAINARRVRDLLNVEAPSAYLHIGKLVRAGILREHTGKLRNRIFIAPDIVSIIESDTP